MVIIMKHVVCMMHVTFSDIMGQSIPRISTTCLPMPTDKEFTAELKAAGMKFEETKDDKEEEPRIMVDVVLPPGWSLAMKPNFRSDMESGFLLNEDLESVASLEWISKPYESAASMCRVQAKRKLNVDVMKKDKMGVWRPKPTLQSEYVDLVNRMYIMQQRGAYQLDLNKAEDNVRSFEKAHSDRIKKLDWKHQVEQKGEERMIVGPMKYVASAIFGPFTVDPPKMFL